MVIKKRQGSHEKTKKFRLEQCGANARTARARSRRFRRARGVGRPIRRQPGKVVLGFQANLAC
jgi:hypothetical protein